MSELLIILGAVLAVWATGSAVFFWIMWDKTERQRDYFRAALGAAMAREKARPHCSICRADLSHTTADPHRMRTVWGEIDDPKGEDLLC